MGAQRFRNGNLLVLAALMVCMFSVFGCGGGGGGGGGTPATPGTPDIALDRNSIDFGNQAIGQTADRSLTVLNTGNGDLVIGGIAVVQPSPFSNYAAADTCSNQTLRPNTSCNILVRFEPTVYGNFLDSFVISSNAGDQPVNLTGNGRDLIVRIAKVDTSGVDTSGGEIKLTVSVTDGSKIPISDLLAEYFSVGRKARMSKSPLFQLTGAGIHYRLPWLWMTAAALVTSLKAKLLTRPKIF